MDILAMSIGYVVMAAGGLLLVLALAWIVGDLYFRALRAGFNMADIMEATAEWKRAHPEKFSRHQERNGVKASARQHAATAPECVCCCPEHECAGAANCKVVGAMLRKTKQP